MNSIMKKFLFMLLAILAGTLSIYAGTPNKIIANHPTSFTIDGIKYSISSLDYDGAMVTFAVLKDTDILRPLETVTYEDKAYAVQNIDFLFLCDYDFEKYNANPIRIIEIPKTVDNLRFICYISSAKYLEEVTVDEDNPRFSSYDGILYSKDYSILLACPKENPCAFFAPGVKEIGEGAYRSCTGIREIEIPPTVTKIGGAAFSTGALTKITLPSSLKYIDNDAFRGTSITSIRLGAEIEHLGYGALATSKSLQSIYCESPVPIQCSFSPFSSYNDSEDYIYNFVTLYVPVGCADAYRAAPYWGNIKHIEEYDYSSNTPVEAARIDIRAEGGAIVVSGNEAVPVEVYRTDGTLVRRTAESRINGLPRGLYIVKVAGSIKKVAL